MHDRNNSESQATPSTSGISRYAFAMFDVLGFSDWVENESLESILSKYRQLIDNAVLMPNKKGSLTAVHTPEGAFLVVAHAPRYAYFSDTILMWCPLAPELASDFVERCSDLFCEALSMSIPLRGAITLGDAILDNTTNTYIGKPIVEADHLEKGQDWLGLTFGNTAAWSPFVAQLHGTSVIEYAAPMKDRFKKYASPIVVDWPRRWRDKNGTDPCDKLDVLNGNPAFAKYYDNAKRFCDFSRSNHDWFKHPERIAPDAVLRLVSLSEADFG